MKNWIRLVPYALLIAVALSVTGCGKDWCISQYGLIDPADCPGPTDGRPIILSKSSGSWHWYVGVEDNAHIQVGGGPANGTLREDFIGIGVSLLRVHYVDGGGDHDVDLLVDNEVPMVHTSDQLKSKYTRLGFAWRLNTVRLEAAPVVEGKVPDEFIGMEPDTTGFPPSVPTGSTVTKITWIPKVLS